MFFTTKKSLLKQNILFAMKSTEIFSKKLLNIFDTLLYTRYNSFVLSMKQYTKYSKYTVCTICMSVTDWMSKLTLKRESSKKKYHFLNPPMESCFRLNKRHELKLV